MVLTRKISKAHRWARNFGGLRQPYPVMAVPPTVTKSTASTINSNTAGAVSHAWSDSRITNVGTTLVDGGLSRGVGSHVTFANGTKTASNAPVRTRFVSDAPAVEIVLRGSDGTLVGAIIDGEYVARERSVVLPNSGNPVYVKFALAADAPTYGLEQAAVSAGGTGYVVGDTITLSGGTGTATVLEVTQVSSGVVQRTVVLTPGAYSAVPTGTISQASTSGSGTGATFTTAVWGTAHTTRKLRKWEFVWHDAVPGRIFGVNVGAQDRVLPWPVPDDLPKICWIGDSITNGTYLRYGGAHMALTISQMLGLHDNCVVNAIGGTGYGTVNTTISPNGPAWADALRIADFVAEAADIYVLIGSQNDAAVASATLTAATTSVLSGIQAALPESIVVGGGPLVVGDGATGTDLSLAVKAGFDAADTARTRYIDNVAQQFLTGAGRSTAETGTGNKDFWLSSDNSHPHQAGVDYLAKTFAPQIADALLEMLT